MHIPSRCECCFYYNKEEWKCKRIGESGDNKGKEGICWMDKGEAEVKI